MVEFIFYHFAVLEVLVRICKGFVLLAAIDEVAAIFSREFLGERCGDPDWRSYPGVELCDLVVDIGKDLDGAASSSNQGDFFTREVVAFRIACRMNEFAFEVMETIDCRPLPFIENPSAIDNKVNPVFELLACNEIYDGDSPLAMPIQPRCRGHLMSQFDVFLDIIVLPFNLLEVLPYFG